jgi:hypothetical protein
LKARLAHLPELAYPNSALPYDLHTDASDIGIGAILVQHSRPLAFTSRLLTSAEQNYSTTEKECLEVVHAMTVFHPYIHGATLTIYTDHAALKSILSTKTPRGRIARWVMLLQGYEFLVSHRKGAQKSRCGCTKSYTEQPRRVAKSNYGDSQGSSEQGSVHPRTAQDDTKRTSRGSAKSTSRSPNFGTLRSGQDYPESKTNLLVAKHE